MYMRQRLHSFGYGLMYYTIKDDMNSLDAAWERSTENYGPVLHEAALIGGRWIGAEIAASVVEAGLALNMPS